MQSDMLDAQDTATFRYSQKAFFPFCLAYLQFRIIFIGSANFLSPAKLIISAIQLQIFIAKIWMYSH